MVKVIWSKQAIENIHELREHYFQISPNYAEKLTDEIFNKEEILVNFPLAGRIVPEINNIELRELIFKNYRIIYQYSVSDAVKIIAIHQSSKPLSSFSLFR